MKNEVKKQDKDITELIFDHNLPVNARVFLKVIDEEMGENKTNNLMELKDNQKVERSLWFLMQQFIGEFGEVNMTDWYAEMSNKYFKDKGDV